MTAHTLETQTSILASYFELLKPRVMALVIFTSACGYFLSPYSLHPFLACIGILSIALGAGASGCLNQWFEAETDKIMSRTCNRPIPSGRIHADEALQFGLGLSVIALLLMQIAIGFWQMVFLAFTIFFYAYVYTVILKPSTDENIVIGGAAGAFPPMIGYFLSGVIDAYAIALFCVIFFWTPPHFWALSFSLKDDYQKAGIPIYINTRGVRATTRMMLVYGLLTAATCYVPLYLGNHSKYAYTAITAINGFWVYYLMRLSMHSNKQHAISVFLYSLIYLFLVFVIYCIDHWWFGTF
ncbi:MAG: heme o synthase [Alphaproteobacteria bacterium]|nr:heme o synthase [Alphaproteobacteria bacterium]